MGTACCATGSSASRHDRRLLWILVFTAGTLVAEVVGGWLSGSLALLADAGHMLADVVALALAWWSARMALKPHSQEKTYGYYRVEILAALINGLILIVASVWIVFEAFTRFFEPHPVEGGLMFWVALWGCLVNAVSAWMLHPPKAKPDEATPQNNLNVRAAYLHVLGDLLGSVGAVGAAIAMQVYPITWPDSVFSVLIAALVLRSAFRLLDEAIHILLEGTPKHIPVPQVRAALLEQTGVLAVHDLHVWSITSGQDAMSAHIVVRDDAFQAETLRQLRTLLKDRFNLSHLTLQLEPPGLEETELHF